MGKKPTTQIKITCWDDQCSASFDSPVTIPKKTREGLKELLELLLEEIIIK